MANGDKGKAQAQSILVKESVQAIVRKLAQNMLPPGSPHIEAEESDAFMEACLMCVFATGDEDPHRILGKLPDFLLSHMASMAEPSNIPRHLDGKLIPHVRKIAQLCLIEWCRRNDYLNGDWAWKWDIPPQGTVSFSPKLPLDAALKLLLNSRQ